MNYLNLQDKVSLKNQSSVSNKEFNKGLFIPALEIYKDYKCGDQQLYIWYVTEYNRFKSKKLTKTPLENLFTFIFESWVKEFVKHYYNVNIEDKSVGQVFFHYTTIKPDILEKNVLDWEETKTDFKVTNNIQSLYYHLVNQGKEYTHNAERLIVYLKETKGVIEYDLKTNQIKKIYEGLNLEEWANMQLSLKR